MSSTMPRGGLRPCTRSIHWPDRSARAAKFLGATSHCVSKRPIWLGEAALLCAALPPTIQRIAGSWRRRSASFTSSYPARRPNTDCRNNPANACRPNPAEQHSIPIHPLGAPWPPRSIQGKMLIAISESRRPRRNSVRYPVNAGFNQFGDLERCALRPGNVHSADGWKDVLDPVVQRYRGKVTRIYFRADAAFAVPEVYEFLEAERIKYAIRLPANQILQGRIGYLLKRPIGRPPNEVRRFHANFSYQAATWTKPRRVIAKVEWHPGELYPRVGFIVTNMSRPAERVVAFYNKRGTCEQWIKEGKGAIKWT